MIYYQLLEYPFQKIGMDLFEKKGVTYLLVVDYFSLFLEIIKQMSTRSTSVITALKSLFSRYGIPEKMVSDNGPQYISQEMKDFAKTYGFKHITSSPHYPQGNGQAERKVRNVNNLFKNKEDPYLSLLSYIATPLTWCR